MLGRLSFIGYSLGGIVIRAALPHLTELASKMHLYLSLSSPHLGCAKGKSALVNTGLWLIRNLKKSVSLQELTLTDSENLDDCYMYQLSQ
jgi:hypothetical protein